jgi:hypothetical protein
LGGVVGQKAGMRRNYTSLGQARRKKSPLPIILLLLLLVLIGILIWLATIDTEVPTQRIEQDVTNEALAR